MKNIITTVTITDDFGAPGDANTINNDRWEKGRARFWRKVAVAGPSQCWNWQAAQDRLGYGRFSIMGRPRLAHRVAYEYAIGPIPDGLVIDHLCRNSSCCNPQHLEPVSLATNTRRGIGIAPRNASKTHCPSGHPYDNENTGLDRRGWRRCRECNRINAKKQQANKTRKLRAES